jgi:hypothetical protein
MRETVAAVAELIGMREGGETTVATIAQALKLDKASALRRARVAIDHGYLRNLEDRKGRPARLVLGDPLPEDQAILPERSVLESAEQGCTVALESEEVPAPPSPLRNGAALPDAYRDAKGHQALPTQGIQEHHRCAAAGCDEQVPADEDYCTTCQADLLAEVGINRGGETS